MAGSLRAWLPLWLGLTALPALPARGQAVTAASGKGVTVGTEDDSFALTLRARVQMRETVSVVDEDTTSELHVRTAAGGAGRPLGSAVRSRRHRPRPG